MRVFLQRTFRSLFRECVHIFAYPVNLHIAIKFQCSANLRGLDLAVCCRHLLRSGNDVVDSQCGFGIFRTSPHDYLGLAGRHIENQFLSGCNRCGVQACQQDNLTLARHLQLQLICLVGSERNGVEAQVSFLECLKSVASVVCIVEHIPVHIGGIDDFCRHAVELHDMHAASCTVALGVELVAQFYNGDISLRHRVLHVLAE